MYGKTLGLIPGRAGVGQTRFLSKVVAAKLQVDRDLKILVVTTSNEPCDAIARKVHEELQSHAATKELIICRAHNEKTERSYSKAYGRQAFDKAQESLRAQMTAEKLAERTEPLRLKKRKHREAQAQDRRNLNLYARELDAVKNQFLKHTDNVGLTSDMRKKIKDLEVCDFSDLRTYAGNDKQLLDSLKAIQVYADELKSVRIENESQNAQADQTAPANVDVASTPDNAAADAPQDQVEEQKVALFGKFREAGDLSEGCLLPDGSIDVQRAERDETLSKAAAALRSVSHMKVQG
ncbi:MAG: hypothetical protein M1818_004305 [Claussenomyces sp. TS43310]|nr:MAG: hypothetical protein M1818_004305 [Claussenomyces sp. TS43310]